MNKSMMMSAGVVVLGFTLSTIPLVTPHPAAAQNPVLKNVVPSRKRSRYTPRSRRLTRARGPLPWPGPPVAASR